MKLDKADIISIIIVILAGILYVLNMFDFKVFAAETPNDTPARIEEEQSEEQEPDTLLEIFNAMKTRYEEERNEYKATQLKLTAIISSTQSALENVSWILTIVTFATALIFVMIFASGWGR